MVALALTIPDLSAAPPGFISDGHVLISDPAHAEKPYGDNRKPVRLALPIRDQRGTIPFARASFVSRPKDVPEVGGARLSAKAHALPLSFGMAEAKPLEVGTKEPFVLDPVRPAPVLPASVLPASVLPAPVFPASVLPAPVFPASVLPAPAFDRETQLVEVRERADAASADLGSVVIEIERGEHSSVDLADLTPTSDIIAPHGSGRNATGRTLATKSAVARLPAQAPIIPEFESPAIRRPILPTATDHPADADSGSAPFSPANTQVSHVVNLPLPSPGRAFGSSPGSRVADLLDVAPKAQLDARINGVKTGRVDFRQLEGTIAIKLGSVLDLLHDRFQPEEYQALRSANAVDTYVPLATLQGAGIPIDYDPVYDEIEFGIDYNDASQAGKVQVEQIGVPSMGADRTAMEQIGR